MKKNLIYTMTVYNKVTNKQVTFIVKDDKTLRMLDSETNIELAEISIDDHGKAKYKALNNTKTPEDAGKCLLECSRGCHGSVLCVAGCAAECATIII